MSLILTSTDHIDLASTPVTGHPMTICAWVKFQVLGAAAQIINIGTSGNNFNRFSASKTLADQFRSDATDGTTTSSAISSLVITDTNVWHHICGTQVDNTNRPVYTDGINVDSTTGAKTVSAANCIRINGSPSGANAGSFQIANLAIWNVALNPSEINELGGGRSNPWKTRPGDLVVFIPSMGYDGQVIDVISGTPWTVTGGTPSPNEPPIQWAPKRKYFFSQYFASASTPLAVTGSSVLSAELSALLSGQLQLNARTTAQSHLIGDLKSTVPLTGLAALDAYLSGSMSASAALGGISSSSRHLMGALSSLQPLSGVSVTHFNSTAGLATGLGNLTGISGLFTHSSGFGAAIGTGALQGSSISFSEARGAMIGQASMVGSGSTGSWLIGNLALNMALTGIASTFSASRAPLTGIAGLVALSPGLASYLVGQLQSSAGMGGLAATFTHARGNLSSGVISSFQRVWVGEAMISGTQQAVSVFSN